MKPHQQYLAELKRRKVFQVVVVYGAAAFVLLQVAELLGEGLRLGETFVPFITAVLILGLPLAVVLAWAFEVTPEGVKRTEGLAPDAVPLSKRGQMDLLAWVGVAALVAGGWWLSQRPDNGSEDALPDDPVAPGSVRLAFANPADDTRPSLAVLPFADMSPESDHQFFSDGMTEEILNVLAKIRDLRVAARTSAFAFKNEQLDMRIVGDSLGVDYLIEGSVRKEADQLRITVQLIETTTGSHVWSDSYDRQLTSVFQIQSEIAEAIATELRLPLGLNDPKDLVSPTADFETYELYLAGRAHLRERGEGLREAIRLFEAAIMRDSAWAPAWAGLAEALEITSWWRVAWSTLPDDPAAQDAITEDYWRDSERAARRALSLDADNASALVALGSVLRNTRRWDASENAYLRALSVDPDNPEGYQQYSEMLTSVGRIREGVRAAEQALALDRVPVRVRVYGGALLYDDRPLEAREVYAAGVADFPEAWDFKVMLAFTYGSLGHFEEFVELHPNIPEDQRTHIVEQLQAGEIPDRWSNDPLTWILLGRTDSMLAALPRMRARSNWNFSDLWHPHLDPIREQPVYLETLRVLNLDGATVDRTPR